MRKLIRKMIRENLLIESPSHVVGGDHYARVGNYEVHVKDVIDTLKNLEAKPVPVSISNFGPINVARPKNVEKYIQVMKQGNWDWKREPLYGQFWDGQVYMFDGNHRAQAGIDSGVYTHLPVVDVDPVLNHVFECVDAGKRNRYDIRAKFFE